MATIDRNTPSERSTAPSSAYTTLNQALTQVYTLNWEVIAYTLMFVVAMVSRFWDLGARVMSHDESLHTYYSWNLYDKGDFDHTPLMHGPLLFHMTALSYFLFGVNDFSGRAYAAMVGVLVVLMPILFRRWLGKVGALLVSIGFLISPMLLYYSRYIRHDMPTILFALIMVYAILQYVDGETPRRPVWLAVLGAATSLMMASKEVSFMYIAIFGSFFTLFWLMRLLQGFTFTVDESEHTQSQQRFSNMVYQVLGHGLATLTALATGYLVGSIIWQFWLVESSPTPIPKAIIQLLAAVAFIFLFNLIGAITLVTGGEFRTLGHMYASGLHRPRSTMMLFVSATILAGVMALVMFSVLDIIKPENIWAEVPYNTYVNDQALQFEDPFEQQQYLQDNLPKAGQKIGATSLKLSNASLQHAMTWILVPVLLLIFASMTIAIIKSPHGRFSWQDFLAIWLIAFVLCGIFVAAERRSVLSHEHHELEDRLEKEDERKQESLRQILGEAYVAPVVENKVNNIWIVLAWVIGGGITAIIAFSRLYTNIWDYLNRQPIFDILISLGTVILPWTAAIPLFAAHYKLDQVPLGPDTVRAAILISIPFFMVSVAVGLSWNWRIWPLVAVSFWLPFAIFFTTFFTNGNGLGTGVIGSLGYWLEQQGVKRGSQPQYYYTFVQMPLYEFMPMILASIAAFFGLSKFFEFRAQSRLAEQTAQQAKQAWLEQEAENEDIDTEAATMALDISEMEEDEFGWTENSPHWQQPYNEDEEDELRHSSLEYLGRIPFLLFLGYWAVVIFLGLTLAGEKMPWLSTHITLPLIMISGWYVGRVIERIKWSSVRNGGWLLVIIIVPVLAVAITQIFLPFFTGESLPFQGNNQIQLESTGQWMAALLGVFATGYFLVRIGSQVGFDQSRRLIFGTVALLLALVTASSAWRASYINYDYATEPLVYAHSGPAVKTVMDDLDYIAARHPEGRGLKVVYDEESTWPFVWYLRDYNNLTYITKESVKTNPGALDGATVVIVGEQKNADVERILGDDYYRFNYIRLWWPMQEYFGLNYERVANVFTSNDIEPSASLYRRGIWDIWWARDYDRYAQAMCVQQRESRCIVEGTANTDKQEYDLACIQTVRRECENDDDRFDVADWPVRDKLFVYVDKQFAVQIWDTGLDGKSVSERLVPDPENVVQRDIDAVTTFGEGFLSEPRGLASDSNGNLYVADTKNSRVVVFDAAGNFMTTIGEGQLNEPWSVAISPVDNNIYVADTWNHRVAVFNLSGELLETYGRFGSIDQPEYNEVDTVFGPRNVTVDLEGYVYIVDTGGHRVRVYDADWTHVRDIGGRGSGSGQLLEPVGIAVHPISGEIYLAETWNQRISVYNRDGVSVRSWPVNMWKGTQTSPNRPYLTISPDGTLILVSDMDATDVNNGPRVVAYDLSGQAVLSFNAPTTSPAYVKIVEGLAFGVDGSLYVADAESSRIVKFPALDVRGNLSPNINPNYAQNGSSRVIPDSDSSPVVELSPDEAANIQLGRQYWEALSTANYAQFVSLYCEANQADLPDEQNFVDSVAAPYLGIGLDELIINPVIDGDTAIVNWAGNLVVEPGTEREFKLPAASIASIELLRDADGGWKICSKDIFRPGGA